MIYQIAKETGAMAAVLEGRVDALLLTGGMAHSERLVEQTRKYIEWIAPITVYPGEDELQALAEGVFRVLNGEEQARRLRRTLYPPFTKMRWSSAWSDQTELWPRLTISRRAVVSK